MEQTGKERILVIDDDPAIRLLLAELAVDLGYIVDTAGDVAQGKVSLQTHLYELVMLDLDLPDGNGLDLFPICTQLPNSPEIIVITGTGTENSAEIAFSYGAWDYLRKPFLIDEVTLQISRAIKYRIEKNKKQTPVVLKRDKIIGNSQVIQLCLTEVAKAASVDCSVLVSGETGTGKELFARAIHDNSDRASGSFIVIDCGALPENLIESLLFGHEKGAFTGAGSRREGLISLADGGTLFLDEIGELDLGIQKKLLRILQERSFRPLGAKNEFSVNFRLIAATNRDLDTLVANGEFRDDLLFRVRSMEIILPPLRKRKEDIQLIAKHICQQLEHRYRLSNKGISGEFIKTLERLDWPGNVRELINVIEQTTINAGADPTLVPKHLPPKYRKEFLCFTTNTPGNKGDGRQKHCFLNHQGAMLKWSEYRDNTEKSYLSYVADKCEGKWQDACNLSGLSKTRLYELLKKHNLSLSSP